MSAHSCHASHMPLPILYAHSNWHTLEALSNQAKLAACCRFWQIWVFQISSQLSGGVFCVLITSHLAQCTAELAGATGRWGLSWDTQTAVGDRSQGKMQWKESSHVSMPGMTGAVVERARAPRRSRRKKGIARSRENFPQAQMAGLKHLCADVNRSLFACSPLLRYCIWARLFHFVHKIP